MWQVLKHDLKAVKAGLSLLQMKYQQEFTSLGENLPCNSNGYSNSFNSTVILVTIS